MRHCRTIARVLFAPHRSPWVSWRDDPRSPWGSVSWRDELGDMTIDDDGNIVPVLLSGATLGVDG